jgi:ankyrin repeat protein
VNQRDQAGRLSLHYAALDNDTDGVAAHLQAGDDPNTADDQGFTPLHFAAQGGGVEVARLLLDSGAEVDAVNLHGDTPLFVAVSHSRGRGDLIDLLRIHGADPLRSNNHGQTPVGLARLIANYDVARHFRDVP